MSKQNIIEFKPFISVLIIVVSLFALVFVKMEVRRLGYSVLRSSQELKKVEDKYNLRKVRYITLTRPDRVRKFALTHLTLAEAKKGQIIQIMGNKVALPQ